MKRAIAAIAIALVLTGCSGTPRTATTTPAAAGVAIPDVTGQAGNDARDALTAAGFVVAYDAGEETVVMASNWTVDAQTPAAGTEAAPGSTVTLTVSKPAAAEPAPAAATSTGLTATYAISACQQYGDTNFPYGWDAHWVLGKLAEEIQNDQWFLKVEADVKNAYNAEAKMNVECFVSGTNDAPVVTSFNAY